MLRSKHEINEIDAFFFTWKHVHNISHEAIAQLNYYSYSGGKICAEKMSTAFPSAPANINDADRILNLAETIPALSETIPALLESVCFTTSKTSDMISLGLVLSVEYIQIFVIWLNHIRTRGKNCPE